AAVADPAAKVVGDGAVVGGGVLERLDRQIEAQPIGQGTTIGVHVLQHAGVVAGVGDDAHVGIVLRRGAHHGGAADIDVLDGVFQAAIRVGDGPLEGVEVRHHQINGLDVVIRHDLIILAAPAKDAAVHFGVQGLHPSVHHFREAGVIGYFANGDAGLLNGTESAARGEQFHAPVGQGPGEVDNTGFIGNPDQRAFYHLAHGRVTESGSNKKGQSALPLDHQGKGYSKPYCLSFLRSVPRFRPSNSAALVWLPRVYSRTFSSSGISISASTIWYRSLTASPSS